MSSAFRIGILLLGTAALFSTGYGLGYGMAEAKGKADVISLKLQWEEERRNNSEAYGRALAESLERYREEAERADSIAASFAENKKKHAAEAEDMQRRIAHVTQSASHTFTAGFVRLYNEAIGLSGDALSEALYPVRADGKTGTCASIGAKRLDPFEGVSEADLLEHITRYGRRCRGLEGQVLGWQALQRSSQ